MLQLSLATCRLEAEYDNLLMEMEDAREFGRMVGKPTILALAEAFHIEVIYRVWLAPNEEAVWRRYKPAMVDERFTKPLTIYHTGASHFQLAFDADPNVALKSLGKKSNKAKRVYALAPLADASADEIGDWLCSIYFDVEGKAKGSALVPFRTAAQSALTFWEGRLLPAAGIKHRRDRNGALAFSELTTRYFSRTAAGVKRRSTDVAAGGAIPARDATVDESESAPVTTSPACRKWKCCSFCVQGSQNARGPVMISLRRLIPLHLLSLPDVRGTTAMMRPTKQSTAPRRIRPRPQPPAAAFSVLSNREHSNRLLAGERYVANMMLLSCNRPEQQRTLKPPLGW